MWNGKKMETVKDQQPQQQNGAGTIGGTLEESHRMAAQMVGEPKGMGGGGLMRDNQIKPIQGMGGLMRDNKIKPIQKSRNTRIWQVDG